MSTIDSRIVTMKFDNTSFQRGVTGTLDLLSKLKTAVTALPSQAKGLAGISTEAKKVDLTPVANQATGIGNAFSAMSVVAVTALATLTHAALNSAGQMAKSLTIAPVAEGLNEYETNLNSIQTIMANTGLEGEKGLGKVQDALDELNHYSDKTIYNFSEMARNIGTFTAAGVGLEESTAAIKGIANLAAVSGSTSAQASTAMYQLSQALAAGKVTLMDWNSVVNAGMGGQVLKDALMETARVHGVAVDDIIKQSGSFRDSISQGWITGEILTETLAKFTGDLSEAQLRNMGYTEAQIEGIVKMGETATDAATKVKTASALINTLQETATSGWSKTWSLILGDFFEARMMFTAANDVLGGMLAESARQRNKMFREWNDLGGRYAAIDAISNSFQALMNILRPIGKAWRDVFPAMTGSGLFEITVAIRDWTEGLIASKDTMRDIRSVFHALFGVLGVGWEIFKGILRYVFDFIGLLTGGAGGVLDFSASIAEIVSALTDWILQGDYIARFFDKIIAGRAALLGPIIDAFGEILSVLAGWVGTGAEVAIEVISAALQEAAPYLDMLADGMERAGAAAQNYLLSAFEKIAPLLQTVKDAIEDALGSLSGIGGNIGGAFGGLGSLFDIGDTADRAADGIDRVKDALSSAGDAAKGGVGEGLSAFGSFLVGFATFVVKIGGAIALGLAWIGKQIAAEIGGLAQGGIDYGGAILDFVGGIFSSIGEAIGNLDMGDIIVALNTIIAAALGGGLARLLFQFGGFFKDIRGVLQSAGAALEGFGSMYTDLGKAAKNEARASLILNMGIALGILAAALYILSKIDGPGLAKGLGAITAMLIMLAIAMRVMTKTLPDKNAIRSLGQMAGLGIALVALAGAMLLMAIALRIMSGMDPGEITKGLLTMAGALVAIVGATVVLNKFGGAYSLIQAAIAIGILAFAMTAFAGALKLYAMLDTGMLVEGGLKVAALVLGLGLAFRAFPATGALAAAAAMLIASGAITIIAGALKLLATMDSGDSWQSILTLGAAMLILAAGAYAMTGAIVGAAAMMVLAGALALFVPTLLLLGQADISTIAIGLGALAAAFIIFGIIGPLVGVGIAILGAGMLVLGAGLALAGAGMFLFGTGLTLLASSAAAALAVMQEKGPQFVRLGGEMFREFLIQTRKAVPEFGRLVRTFLIEAVKTIILLGPLFLVAGIGLVVELLKGLDDRMPELVERGVDVVESFLKGVGDNADRLVAAAGRVIGKFASAIGSAIRGQASELKSDALQMGVDMVQGLWDGLVQMWHNVEDWLADKIASIPGPLRKIMGMASPSKVMAEFGRNISLGVAEGVRQGGRSIDEASEDMGKNALFAMRKVMADAHNALDIDPNMSPVITPVLDLTQMANEASAIGTMLAAQPLSADVSYSAASALAAEQQAIADAEAEYGGDGDVIFEQHLHSPKALDDSTIYRSTRNQFAMAKEALKK